jgi:predicted cobalt transporter CbtA
MLMVSQCFAPAESMINCDPSSDDSWSQSDGFVNSETDIAGNVIFACRLSVMGLENDLLPWHLAWKS